jgi:hypothetical protein
MESNAPTQAPTTLKVIEVEPAAAGPDVKPVRQKKPLTEAQKAALQRGRERLAERRKQMKEGNEQQQEPSKQPVAEVPSSTNEESDSDDSSTSSLDTDEQQSTAYCSMM